MGREAVDTKDRPLGPRALRTRRKLLDATAGLLAERGLRELAVVEIARRAETSPATFYQYFGDVEAAALELASETTTEFADVLAALPDSFAGGDGLDQARAFVSRFLEIWDAHHAVLRVRNHAADEGDPRFRRVRRKALRPLLDRLAERLSGERGSRYARAAALATVLESLSAHYGELEQLGVDREALVETTAHIFVDTAAQ